MCHYKKLQNYHMKNNTFKYYKNIVKKKTSSKQNNNRHIQISSLHSNQKWSIQLNTTLKL